MSASANVFWRGISAILHAVGLIRQQSVCNDSSGIAMPTKLSATIELTEAPLPPDGGTPAALPVPVPAAAHVARHHSVPAFARPLASQLAFTASRNVPKGRKPAQSGKKSATAKTGRAAALPRRASVIKAKPVVIIATKKKAPKRRHVWLSSVSRVIRPVSNNVVPITTQRTARNVTRPATQRTTRQLKLAA